MLNTNFNVSVIIPTYNSVQYICRAIESVLNQTYKDFEIIVVDDGSTDNTKGIMSKVFLEDKRVKYFYQNNSGKPSIAKNRGIKLASGKYISFLDADDTINKHKLGKMVRILDENENINFVFADCRLLAKNGKVLAISRLKYVNNNILSEIHESDIDICNNFKVYKNDSIFNLLAKGSFIHGNSVLIRKSCIENVGLFDTSLKVAEDWEFFIRASKGQNIAFIDEVLSDYYKMPNSVTKNYRRYYLDSLEMIKIKKQEEKKNLIFVNNSTKKISDLYYGFASNCYYDNKIMRARLLYCAAIKYDHKILFKRFTQIYKAFLPKKIIKFIRGYKK